MKSMILKNDYYDVRSAVEDLSGAGMSEQSAKAIVEYVTWCFNNRQQEQLAHFSTKEDLAITTLELKKEIEEIKREIEGIKREIEGIKREILEVKLGLQKEIEVVRKEIVVASNRTILWIAGILLANTGLIVSLMKLL